MKWLSRFFLMVFTLIITGMILITGETGMYAQDVEEPLPVKISQKPTAQKWTSDSLAVEEPIPTDWREVKEPIPAKIGQKLFRGTANITTGWMEIPKEIYLSTEKSGPLIGILLGTFNGVGMTYVRITGGVYETATFLIPFPWNYQPLVQPEYVWIAEESSESLP